MPPPIHDRPSLSVVNLGCSKNQVEAERLIHIFEQMGCRYTGDSLQSDVVLINTCGFIQPAQEQSVDTILGYLRHKKEERPGMRVVVSGCLYERFQQDLSDEMPEVDGWIRGVTVENVQGVLSGLGWNPAPAPEAPSYGRPVLLNEPGVAYLKISEGCDRPCSFCAIPGIKGSMRSRPVEELVAEVRQLVEQHDIREINVVAQDPVRYGKDLPGCPTLEGLLERLLEVEGFRWIRLLYLFPGGLSPGLVSLIAQEDRVASYLDIPYQHASRSVLKRMKRPGDGDLYLEEIAHLREEIRDLVLRTTLLAGHPGETEADFRSLCEFVERARFQWLGVFPYSSEEGTASAEQDGVVPPSAVRERTREVQRIFEGHRDLGPFRLGEEREALVVERTPGGWVLRDEGHAPEVDGSIHVPRNGGEALRPGELARVRLLEEQGFDFLGSLVEEPDGRDPVAVP